MWESQFSKSYCCVITLYNQICKYCDIFVYGKIILHSLTQEHENSTWLMKDALSKVTGDYATHVPTHAWIDKVNTNLQIGLDIGNVWVNFICVCCDSVENV